MKRYLKSFFITLASFLILLIVAVSILFWLVFTPQRLTPVVRNQSEKYIPYPTEIGEVELTFFSTFPQFGIKVSNFSVISSGTGAPEDTLLKVDELTGIIDAVTLLKSSNLIIKKFILSNGSLNVFTDNQGHSNYGLLMIEPATGQQEPSGMGFDLVDMENLELINLNISYTDLASKLNVIIASLNAQFSGTYKENSLMGHLDLSNANVYFEYDEEKFLDKARIKFNIPFEILLSRQLVKLKDAFASVNDLGITINGFIENDTVQKNIVTDISYQLNTWPVKDAVALIPPGYFDDFGVIDASGFISSDGLIKGVVNDSLLPLMDINMELTGGNIMYEDLPFPLSEMSGDINIFSDFNNDKASWLYIRHFKAKTPNSIFETRGKVDNIYSDMHFNLLTDINVMVDEFGSFVPDDMDLNVNGRINGQVKSDFTMSQLSGIELDKMKLSGSGLLSDFSIFYDSLSMETGFSKIDFSLPNTGNASRNSKFAFLKISSDTMRVSKIEDFSTSMINTHFFMEMSDLRDTTVIPDLFCTFSIGSLQAGMDTINLNIDKPLGYFSVSPAPDIEDQPAFQLGYTSYEMEAHMGQSFIFLDDITIKTDFVNDNTQEDVFLQWPVNGFIDMSNGTFSLSTFTHPVEIPVIKMEFDPETFNIYEGTVIIDQSDYGLTGVLDNVSSWFKGDSLLRGNFNFVSGNTDLAMLMSLTSGIGVEDERVNVENENISQDDKIINQDSLQPDNNSNNNNSNNNNSNNNNSNNNNAFTGPYMVPQGIDFLIRADVRQATMGSDTAINILGDIRVNDGILLLDDLTFTTPAADMQLTAMYRTPRKNHLYLGLDYHMLDVEISRLLKMIPDIDTLMPMLRSFEGSGEFHIAVETYLDSLYNVKKSTLRGASSIKGNDLVLMDGETFSEISRSLRFRNREENRVDSLSAEFTIFREEIDIYPFIMVMDRYKAVIGGRHNFDLSFDYHISLIESPLPFRLGIDIKGNMEDLKYRLARPKYAELYRPVSRRAVQSRQLELRRMIREALLQNMKE